VEVNNVVPAEGSAEGVSTEVEKKKKKKKPKYSKNLKPIAKIEKGAVRAQRRLANAVVAGLETWEKRRDRSSKKKKDGAIRDALQNSAAAMSKSMRVASRAATDLVSSVPKARGWKAMRSIVFFPFG